MMRSLATMLLAALALAGCAGMTSISPNDPQYARSGAPRAGEPMVSPENAYGRIMGPDSGGDSR